MNIQMLMKQANEMQRKIEKIEKELENKVYEKSLGGGAIQVEITGANKLKSIKIDEEILDTSNKEMIEEMLVTGLNEILQEVKKEKDSLMGSLTGGVKFPGVF